MRLIGWSLKQWALAIGQLKEVPVTLHDAIALKKKYLTKGIGDPVEELAIIVLHDDPRPCDEESALKLFDIVSKNLGVNLSY